MKKKIKNLTGFLVVLGMTSSILAGTAFADDPVKLDPPQGITVNYGSEQSSSADDTVSFEAVENAVSYKVYVYVDGSKDAKVTEGTDTTISIASPLDAGEYLVFVTAVGDGDAYANSGASEKVNYTVEEAVKTKLGQVSDIAMDFSKVDPDNSVYPTISFSPVENAGRYLVDVYAADANGEKQLTDLGYTTRFTVPGKQADGYMIDSTNYNDLCPGFYVVSVTAMSNHDDYENGDPAEELISWIGVDAIQPEITAEEAEEGGIILTLTNNESYNAGITLDVYIYADEQLQELVKQDQMKYTTSEFFGTINYNNTYAIEVKDPADAGEGDLVTGTKYYAVMSFDPAVYNGDVASDPVSFTCQQAGTGAAAGGSSGGESGGGEAPGGPGGEAGGEGGESAGEQAEGESAGEPADAPPVEN